MKGAENLEEEDSIEPILRQGTWGIGFIGLAEALTALIGKHHGENDEARELGVRIVTFIRQYTDKFSQETDRKSTRLNSSHLKLSRMPSSA